ncbi:MAG: ABC transporter ATP-binding protein [Actinomycetota bacterium]|nr:ABC transporter ATP-binding protein [Actinomycetota bacterium]
MANAIEVDGVSKIFRLYQEKYTSLKERVIKAGKIPYQEFWALKDININVEEGTSIGLLGHNGSGKSTLLKCIAGIIQPTKGEIRVKGRVSAMLEVGAGFHPELSGRDNIFLSATLLGVPVKEIAARFDDIVEFSELGAFIDNQVKHYSTGMYARLGFAVAVNVDPDVLLVDEVLAVGDENFQRKCIERIRLFQKEGRTIVFVSHSPELVRATCEEAYVLDHGSVVGAGDPGSAIAVLRESLQAGAQVGGARISDPDKVEEPKAEKVPNVELVSIRAVSASEERPDHIFPHDPLKVEVGYHARSPQPGTSVAIQLFSPQKEVIFAANTREMGIEGFDLDSDGVVEINFEDLALLDGIYGVAVTLLDSGGNPISWLEDRAAFQVVNPSRVSGMVALNFSINSYSVPHIAN